MSQEKMILRALRQGQKITPIDALMKFGCNRLAARICDIKKFYHIDVKKDWYTVRSGKRVAVYYL